MPAWRKFRLALVVIVKGILLCRTQPVKPSLEVVEMVKDTHFFLHYPWGRHSFKRLLRMVTIGDYIPDKPALINKLKQSSLDVHGFPLPIQLLAFRCIPLILKFLPHSEDQSTFLDEPLTYLPKCKSYHTSNILSTEHDRAVKVLFPFSAPTEFRSTAGGDPKRQVLEAIVSSGNKFVKSFSFGGDASLPSLYALSTRKTHKSNFVSPASEVHDRPNKRKHCKKINIFYSVEDVDGIVTLKLRDLKDSLLADLGQLLFNSASTGKDSSSHRHQSAQVASDQHLSTSPLTPSASPALIGLSPSSTTTNPYGQPVLLEKITVQAATNGE
ncbi:PREDICTED: uncharacterized protein LOC104792972 isoform X1 [Camelina sativa]|uniref:Uncharacterized protein LOC104792972 isoform X1 n=1 Tax=Camelina sativa TaxID=90675 RepID=A0ABM0ZLT5_CAMSA|nr:PREDICTED: uncharacterized protein LOC104792972 isoform X1 [Camelina sativa]